MTTPDVTVALPGSRTRLPGSVRALLTADLVTAFGVGLTQPYLVVLLHTARGVPLATATAIVSSAAFASLLGNPIAGALIDRFGARRIMAAGVGVALLGSLVLGLVDAPVPNALAVAATGFGWSLSLPALATRIAVLVPEARHSRAYTFQYVLFNVGMGGGAALAGATLVARAALPALWLAAACTCAASAVVALSIHADAERVNTAGQSSTEVPAGYRFVLADGALRRLLVAVAALSTVGYGMFLAVPAVLALEADDPVALAWATAANAAVIVLGLPIALRVGAKWPPRSLLVVTALLWAAAWACSIPLAFGAGPGVRLALAVTAALIGAGELLLAGALPTIVNGLAPEGLRGRYNALSTLALTVGMASGPLLTAVATGVGGIRYLVPAAAGVALLALVTLRSAPTPRPSSPR